MTVSRDHFPDCECLGSATRFAEDIHAVIDHAPLFDELSFQEIEALFSFMVCYAGHRHTVLLREGERGDFVIVLLTGRAMLSRLNPAGGNELLGEVRPGSALGEISMLDGTGRGATCIASEPVDFAVLDRQALDAILLTKPHLGSRFLLRMLQMFAAQVRTSREPGGASVFSALI